MTYTLQLIEFNIYLQQPNDYYHYHSVITITSSTKWRNKSYEEPIFLPVLAYPPTHIHTHTYTHTCTHARHTDTHSFSFTHAHTFINNDCKQQKRCMYVCACVRACVRVCVFVCALTAYAQSLFNSFICWLLSLLYFSPCLQPCMWMSVCMYAFY